MKNSIFSSVFYIISIFSICEVLNASSLFTESERKIYQERKTEMVETSTACLEDTYQEHLAFFAKHKISKFYGDRHKDYATRAGRIQALKKYGADPKLIDQLEPMSCIGLTMKCLKKGFDKIGLSESWNKIYSQLAVDKKFLGTDLIAHLRDLGWKVYYWNPDPSLNAQWDIEDRQLNPAKTGTKWNPVWGGHALHYNSVMKKGTYYGIKVDDAKTLVGFKTTQPSVFTAQPFFVGVAHAGYHVFPGRRGEVIEAHSRRELNSLQNLEFSQFNPIAPGGGPLWTRSEHYRSGILAIP